MSCIIFTGDLMLEAIPIKRMVTDSQRFMHRVKARSYFRHERQTQRHRRTHFESGDYALLPFCFLFSYIIRSPRFSSSSIVQGSSGS